MIRTEDNRAAVKVSALWESLSVLCLLAVVALAWCEANGKWSPADWTVPTAYGDLHRSDVLQHLAFFKAAKDGDFVPFRSKIVPKLGAPGQANWNDWPIVEEFQIYAAGLLARGVGIFAALNVALLLGHLLAAASFYLAARLSRASVEWAFIGGLAFGLAPFLFAQSPQHPFVQWCWHIPLFLLVWRWVAVEPGLALGSRRFWAAIVIALLAGFQMVYYTAVFAQLVLLGALVTSARGRTFAPLLAAILVILAAAGAFALMNIDTWAYRWAHGANPGALVREFKWVEVYGLSLANLFVPPISHHWELFRAFAEHHAAESALIDEGSYLGLAGVAAFLFLVGTAVWAIIQRRPERVPLEAWQALWIILFFAAGGLNAVAGLGGFTYLRTGCRYSIVLLALALLFAARSLSAQRGRPRVAARVLALLLAGLILWDQVPRAPTVAERNVIAQQIESDRKFVEAMESTLPTGAMVFQIPVMDFPEAPSAALSPSDHFRPYLYSRGLRFSFGTDKGRASDDWPHQLEQLPIDQVFAQVKARGFAALYINRQAFPDNGDSLLQALTSLGYDQTIHSAAGDLVCVRLKQPTNAPSSIP